jgi:hypothetical protein
MAALWTVRFVEHGKGSLQTRPSGDYTERIRPARRRRPYPINPFSWQTDRRNAAVPSNLRRHTSNDTIHDQRDRTKPSTSHPRTARNPGRQTQLARRNLPRLVTISHRLPKPARSDGHHRHLPTCVSAYDTPLLPVERRPLSGGLRQRRLPRRAHGDGWPRSAL